jgi:hypothetical protein
MFAAVNQNRANHLRLDRRIEAGRLTQKIIDRPGRLRAGEAAAGRDKGK